MQLLDENLNRIAGESESDSESLPTSERHHQHSMLRIIADDYDQAQRTRVAKGEQIRAIAQGRDQSESESERGYLAGLGFFDAVRNGKVVKSASDALLEAILADRTDEPNYYLSTAYRRSYEMERAAYARMSELLDTHPAWHWMSQIRGVGPTLGAKLLSRLDINLASNASSFWLYCGLATVPGQRWQCPDCGYVGIHPATHQVTGKHKKCKTLAVLTHGADSGVRAALPRAESGSPRCYDSFAKKTLYLLASSWLKSGEKSYYAGVYRRKIAFYDRERVGWERGRKHYSALRVAEKLFLSHLYEAWCVAIGREPGTVDSYAQRFLRHDGIVRAAEVIEWERRAKEKPLQWIDTSQKASQP